ncbi:MAG: hypothetical protein EPN79_08825 [Burkholderiaceae bacterium]|nr:MAG: hypothetical protein EPN79_08825 [Burkholderiaceae bacterium]TBR75410.1 MAG: hypothetical protein EPN64_12960 [Burkholderiaceae bacterium]
MLEAAVKARDMFGHLVMKANVRTDEASLIGAGLCLTIQELFASAILLTDNGLGSHAPSHVRTMLEALADLRNLANDPTYIEQMRFDDARSNLKLFKGYAAVPGMEQKAIDTLKDWAAKAQSVADAGSANGYKKLQIADKLKMADLEQEYVSYGFLCGFTHNQLTAIIARHGKHQLKYLHEPPYETAVGVLGLGLSIAGKAIQKLPAFSDLTDPEVNASVDEIEAGWEKARA